MRPIDPIVIKERRQKLGERARLAQNAIKASDALTWFSGYALDRTKGVVPAPVNPATSTRRHTSARPLPCSANRSSPRLSSWRRTISRRLKRRTDMDMLGDDEAIRRKRLASRVLIVATWLWLAAGASSIALAGYQFWNGYTQRRDAYALTTRIEARDKALHKDMDRELARWRRVNDKLERLYGKGR